MTEQRIFGYHDGAANVFADPRACYRRLWIECDGNPNDLIKRADSESPGLAKPAEEKILAAVRKVFDLKAIDRATGQGATDDDVYAILDRFTDFLIEKKNPSENSPTSAPPTGCLPG